jgi:hypothetical protein
LPTAVFSGPGNLSTLQKNFLIPFFPPLVLPFPKTGAGRNKEKLRVKNKGDLAKFFSR